MKPNRKRGLKEKVQRNDELLTDYLAGYKITWLIEKYKISKQRIYQIIKRY